MNNHGGTKKAGKQVIPRDGVSGSTALRGLENSDKVRKSMICGNDATSLASTSNSAKSGPSLSAPAGPSNASKSRNHEPRVSEPQSSLEVFGFSASRKKPLSGSQPATRPTNNHKKAAGPPPPDADIIEITSSSDEGTKKKPPLKPQSAIMPPASLRSKPKPDKALPVNRKPSSKQPTRTGSPEVINLLSDGSPKSRSPSPQPQPQPRRVSTARKHKGKPKAQVGTSGSPNAPPVNSNQGSSANSVIVIELDDDDDEGPPSKSQSKGKAAESFQHATSVAGPSNPKSSKNSTPSPKPSSLMDEAFADDEDDFGMDVDQPPFEAAVDVPSVNGLHSKSNSPVLPDHDSRSSLEPSSRFGAMVIDEPISTITSADQHPGTSAVPSPRTPLIRNVSTSSSQQHVQNILQTPLRQENMSLPQVTPSPKPTFSPPFSSSQTPTSSQRPIPLPVPRSLHTSAAGSPSKPYHSESTLASPNSVSHRRKPSDDINLRGLEKALESLTPPHAQPSASQNESMKASPLGTGGISSGLQSPLSDEGAGELPRSPTNAASKRPTSALPKSRSNNLSRRGSLASGRSSSSKTITWPPSRTLVEALNQIQQDSLLSQQSTTPKHPSTSVAPVALIPAHTPAASTAAPTPVASTPVLTSRSTTIAEAITRAGQNNHITRPSKRRLSQTDFEHDHHLSSKGKGKGKEKVVVSPPFGGSTEEIRDSSAGSSISTHKLGHSLSVSGYASDISEDTPDTSSASLQEQNKLPADNGPILRNDTLSTIQTSANMTEIIADSQQAFESEITTTVIRQKTVSTDGSGSALFSSTPTLVFPAEGEEKPDDLGDVQVDVEMEDVMDEKELEAALIPDSLPVSSGAESDLDYTGIPGVESEGTSNPYARSSGRSSPQASENQFNPAVYPTHESTPEDDRPLERYFGGYKAMSWRSYRANLANFPPKYCLAKDLPHSLQDLINSMDESSRRLPGMRHVFEAALLQNTATDEPLAPPITVINEVDDDPAPPWEFHYSNQMWHNEGVPLPDMKNLLSCKCIGKCDPRNKHCACAQRQMQQSDVKTPDFAYDTKGRLKLWDYPIFECNELCACNDECRNRVIQHGRQVAINIAKTVDKGWGVFAGSKKIYKGTFIGIYAGELLTDAEGEKRGMTYNKGGRTYLFDLDFHHLQIGNPNWTTKYVVDAYHAGNFTRFLNHSCDPNCSLNPCYINEANIDKPLLAIFAVRDIEPFEEICFSYYGEADDDDYDGDPDARRDRVYAQCRCGAGNCSGDLFK